MKKIMIKIFSILLFILWLLGAFGYYSIGWPTHILLVVSIMLFFISTVDNKNPEITEIMNNSSLSREEAEQVRKIMNRNRLNEQESLKLLKMRSKYHSVDNSELIKTEAAQIRKIMNKNRVDQREALELLSFRLRLHHR